MAPSRESRTWPASPSTVQRVWFASGDRLNALDPESGDIVGVLDVAGDAGTAFDGKHLFQIAEAVIQKIDPATGEVLGTIPAPGNGGDSGLAWADGSLWVGQHRDRRIHQVDPETGAVLRTIEFGSLRHRRHLGRRRALAWHLGGRDERRPPHRSRDRRGARAPRNAGGDRRLGARVGRRRPVLLRRQWQGESHPPTEKLTHTKSPSTAVVIRRATRQEESSIEAAYRDRNRKASTKAVNAGEGWRRLG